MRYYLLTQNSNQKAYPCFISGGLFVSNGQWCHPKRIIHDYELIYVLKGNVKINNNGINYTVSPGQLLVIPPETCHYGLEETDENISFYWVHFKIFNGHFDIESNVSSVLINKKQEVVKQHTGIIFPEFIDLKDTYRIKPFFKQLLHYANMDFYTNEPCDLLVGLLLNEITQEFINQDINPANTNKSVVVSEICEWIRANHYTDISVSGIAEKFGYNREYLSRLFKRKNGMSIKAYIIDLRLEKAKSLLSETQNSIKFISQQIGISDDKVFMKLFKQKEGMTPSQYRQAFGRIHFNSR